MSGLIDRFSQRQRRARKSRSGGGFANAVLAALAFASLGALGGCSVATPAAVSDIRYDLGPAPRAVAQPGPLPAVRMFDVRVPRALDTDAILYRPSDADPRRTAVYTHSHWTMTPARMLTQRLRAALTASGAVLGGGELATAPLLSVDLEQFEQVDDGEGESHGALTARATLTRDGRVLAQRTFVAGAPATMPSAAGAVGALASASDEFIAQLIVWLGMEADVG